MRAFSFPSFCVLILVVGLSMATTSCTEAPKEQAKEIPQPENPAAPGFNEAESDTQAIALANRVMKAMGGRQNWDQARFISWDFFGARKLLWNKTTGDVRIESERDSFRVVLNVHTQKGKVWRKGVELSDPDSVAKYVKKGRRIWINDAYWLVMPYKLKDSGVTLKYVAEDTTQSGLLSDVLELTFASTGVTPENKYHVWIDRESSLVRQWSFFDHYEDDSARFVTPWDNYQLHGGIQLSSSRGPNYDLNGIQVQDSVDAKLFESLDAAML